MPVPPPTPLSEVNDDDEQAMLFRAWRAGYIPSAPGICPLDLRSTLGTRHLGDKCPCERLSHLTCTEPWRFIDPTDPDGAQVVLWEVWDFDGSAPADAQRIATLFEPFGLGVVLTDLSFYEPGLTRVIKLYVPLSSRQQSWV